MTNSENDNPENDNKQETDPLILKVKNEIDTVEWPLLEPHYERGALVFIDPQLDIVNVAAKVIRDDVDDIKNWADQKLIYNPKDEDIEINKEVKYRFIITQPYVLIQPIITEETTND